jgi:NADPH-dependent glutamate synthase beta subunit-like oxidoreductase/NAD-dependent dihydropyrimidine dehydrogenase PreA subunit
MIEAVLMMGGLGVVVGAGLAAASKIFYVYVDPLIEAIEGELPGANCGGCGFAGCSANAAAIAAGKSSPDSCVAASPEVAEAIAKLLGVSVGAKDREVSRLGCTYSVDQAETKFRYDGVMDCRAAMLMNGGTKVCEIGCLGLGSCVKACMFGALSMGPQGLPVVDEAKCTGCGACERTCPKHIIRLSSITRRILHEYTTEDCTTPCQRTCPAGIDIAEYIRLIGLKQYHESVQVIKERNPFPTVIGRICPRPCETQCRRQLADEPVAINGLKRFAADYERSTGKRILPRKAPSSGKKIAVVGGGVEGLSAAYFSTRLGHAVTVFEATERLGGLLRSAIARNRLPLEILDWDINGVLEMGVEARPNTLVGKDVAFTELFAQEGFDAVLLASGGWDSRLARGALGHIEQPVPGIYLLIDALRFGPTDTPSWQGHVVIAGGEAAAIEAAVKIKQTGADRVTILYREDEALLPASITKAQLPDGISIIYRAGVQKLKGEAQHLKAIEYVNTGNGISHTVDAEVLILAAGRFPELIVTPAPKPEASETPADTAAPLLWEAIAPYRHPDYADEKGWLGEGDALSDFSGAIRAIAAGRREAVSVHQRMHGIPLSFPETILTPHSIYQNVDHVEAVAPAPRQIMPVSDPDLRLPDTEIEIGFSEETALKEASRCLQCGLICYRKSPMAAVAN